VVAQSFSPPLSSNYQWYLFFVFLVQAVEAELARAKSTKSLPVKEEEDVLSSILGTPIENCKSFLLNQSNYQKKERKAPEPP